MIIDKLKVEFSVARYMVGVDMHIFMEYHDHDDYLRHKKLAVFEHLDDDRYLCIHLPHFYQSTINDFNDTLYQEHGCRIWLPEPDKTYTKQQVQWFMHEAEDKLLNRDRFL